LDNISKSPSRSPESLLTDSLSKKKTVPLTSRIVGVNPKQRKNHFFKPKQSVQNIASIAQDGWIRDTVDDYD